MRILASHPHGNKKWVSFANSSLGHYVYLRYSITLLVKASPACMLTGVSLIVQPAVANAPAIGTTLVEETAAV